MKTFSILLLFIALPVANFGAAKSTKVLIAYYSRTGHTEAMAQAVADGAGSIPDIEVVLRTVAEASTDDVLTADAIIVGSPVYNANIAPPVMEFINSWPFKNAPMQNKIGAAFVAAGGMSAGEELVQMNIVHAMLVFGMIVVGGPNWRQAFGASAIVEEAPFGQKSSKKIAQDQFLEKGKALGKRVATLAKKWKSIK